MENKYGLWGWIGNLGMYNEGLLKGEWVKFPVSEEKYNEVLDKIGISPMYEETFIGDYDNYTEIPTDSLKIGEQSSIGELNKIASAIEIAEDENVIETVLATMDIVDGDFECAFANAMAGNTFLNSNIKDDSDLGYEFVQECGIDKSLDYYIDYEKYGRDIEAEYYPQEEGDPETAAEFYCGRPDASDYDLGCTVADEIGIENVNENYIDYEKFGREIQMDDQVRVCDYGALSYWDYDSGLRFEDVPEFPDFPEYGAFPEQETTKISLNKETMAEKREQAKAHNESVKSAPAKDKLER